MSTSTHLTGETEAAVRPVFRKGLGRLTGLVLLNGVFEFLSLGLFRFWSRTRLRRFYWNHAVIDGAPLEYDGRGEELLSGFLQALVVLIVPGAALFLCAIALLGREALLGPADWLFTLVLLPLIPVALYRARGYRLSRTYWRGIGFHQDGSTWRYGLLWMYWLMLCLLTLGLAVPWRNVAVQRYRMKHTRYGDLRFDFTGSGRGLIVAWMVPWLCGAVTVPSAVVASLHQANASGLLFPAAQWALWAVLAFVVLFIRYRTIEFRYFATHTKLGPLRFDSRLRSPVVVALLLPHLAIAAVLIVVNITLTVQLAQAILDNDGSPMTADLALFVALLLASVLILTMLVSLSYNLLARYGLLRAVCGSLKVTNLTQIDAAPAHVPRPRRGEGWAEAFDLGAM